VEEAYFGVDGGPAFSRKGVAHETLRYDAAATKLSRSISPSTASPILTRMAWRAIRLGDLALTQIR
jgi:hypothetical protein